MSEQTKEITEQGGAVTGVSNEVEAKFKRTVVALTVGAVLLLSVLIILMCYQLIAIGVKNYRLNQLESDIATLKQEHDNGEKTLEIRRQWDYIEMRARKLGYKYPGDN